MENGQTFLCRLFEWKVKIILKLKFLQFLKIQVLINIK